MTERKKSDIELALETVANPDATPLAKEIARRLLQVAVVNEGDALNAQGSIKKTGDSDDKESHLND